MHSIDNIFSESIMEIHNNCILRVSLGKLARKSEAVGGISRLIELIQLPGQVTGQ